jgi:ribonuclease P protein component
LSRDDPAAAGGDERTPPPGGTRITRLLRRREFLAAARGIKTGRGSFLLQAVARPGDGAGLEVGIGITVTKKIGGSVVRNRARRRLREALRRALPPAARPGHDYVVVARPGALTQPFDALVADLGGAIRGLGARLPRGGEG